MFPPTLNELFHLTFLPLIIYDYYDTLLAGPLYISLSNNTELHNTEFHSSSTSFLVQYNIAAAALNWTKCFGTLPTLTSYPVGSLQSPPSLLYVIRPLVQITTPKI